MRTNGKYEVIARIAGPGLALAAVFALVLSGSSVGRAQSSATSPAVPAATPAKVAPAAPTQIANSAEKPAGGLHQGIIVHGYWKIDVHNADGSLAKHVEFENNLASGVTNGSTVLVNLIRGTTVSLGPAIQVGGNMGDVEEINSSSPVISYNVLSGTGPCGGNDCLLSASSSVFYSNCLWIVANASQINFPGTSVYNSSTCVGGLTVSGSGYNPSQSLPTSLPDQVSLSLSGSFVATTSAQVTQVSTIVDVCRFDEYASGACAAPSTAGSSAIAVAVPFYLTEFSIPAPTGSSTPGVSVTSGQSVNVSVTLGFGSGS
jgi:hypothetical protein